MEVEVPKTKTHNAFRILQTTSSFNVPQMVGDAPRGIVAGHKCPVGFPDRCSNYRLGTYFQLSRIHDTLALLT